jgi:hypothetical protein
VRRQRNGRRANWRSIQHHRDQHEHRRSHLDLNFYVRRHHGNDRRFYVFGIHDVDWLDDRLHYDGWDGRVHFERHEWVHNRWDKWFDDWRHDGLDYWRNQWWHDRFSQRAFRHGLRERPQRFS